MVDSGENGRGTRRRAAAAAGVEAGTKRDIMPTDGSVAHFGNHASIYCARCERWVDCHDGIAPETALERHSALLH